MKLICLVILILGSMLCPVYGASVDPMVVSDSMTNVPIGRHSALYVDDSGTMTFDQVRAAALAGDFEPSTIDSPKFGFTDASIWSKITLENPSSSPLVAFLESKYQLLDYITLYMPTPEGYQQQRVGDRVSAKDKIVRHRRHVLKLEVPPGVSTWYIKTSSQGSLNLPYYLWGAEPFVQNSENEYQIVGLIYGFLAVMFAYNIFLTISFRSITYLAYCGYIIFFIGYAMGFLGSALEVFDDAMAQYMSNEGLLLNIQLTTLFGCIFAYFFFDIKDRSKKAKVFFALLIGFAVLISVVSQIVPYNTAAKLVNLYAGIHAITIIIYGTARSIKGYRPAIYYTIAFLCLMAGNLSLVLSVGGIIPVGLIATWGNSVGACMEVVLLSLALGDRVNFIRNAQEQKIRDLNGELERHIVNIEQIVEEKTRDIRSIMQNIQQGVFTLQSDPSEKYPALIGEDFSAHLTDMLDVEDLSGRNVMETVFNNTDLGSDNLNLIDNILRSSVGEDEIGFSINADNLPNEFNHKNLQDQWETYEIDWNPVLNESSQLVDKVLVTIRDVTHLRKLQAEAQANQEELEYIGAILNVPADKFNRFIEVSTKYMGENQNLLDSNDKRNDEALKLMFMNLHTIKGMARSFHLHHMTDVIHDAEQYFADELKSKGDGWDKKRMNDSFQAVREAFERYQYINQEKLGRVFEKDTIVINKDVVRDNIDMLDRLEVSSLSRVERKLIEEARDSFANIFYQNTNSIFEDIFSIVDGLSRDLHKESPKIEVENPGIQVTDEGAEILENVFIHIIRNSMDHGIETPSKRIAAGKLPRGLISINLSEENNLLVIRYQDDGAGLDLDQIKATACDHGLISPELDLTPMETAELIFLDGISTAGAVTEISGRGVGMSAIKKYIELAGGEFSVEFVGEPKPRSAPFLIKMTLTDEYYKIIGQHKVA